MTPQAEVATNILVALALATQATALILIALRFFFVKTWRMLAVRYGHLGYLTAMLFSVSALVGSMIYGDITGFEACPLCWASRILMIFTFGTLLFGIKSALKHRFAFAGTLLAVLGLCVSGYQYLLQWLALKGTHLPCPAVSSLPSCDKVYFVKFGFITIPFVAFSAFLLILLLLAFFHERKLAESSL